MLLTVRQLGSTSGGTECRGLSASAQKAALARGDRCVHAAGQLEDGKAGSDDTQALLQQQHKRLTEERHAAVQVGTACLANVSCLSCWMLPTRTLSD